MTKSNHLGLKCIAVALILIAPAAFAQDKPQKIDPRTVAQTVNALQAILALREAEMKAMQEDYQKRESDWAAYSAPLWQAPVKK